MSVRAFARVCVWGVHGCGLVLERVWPYLSSMPRAGALLSAASLAPSNFSTVSHKRYDFWKKLLNVKYVLIFSTNLV